MRSERATFAIRIAFSGAAALLILAGASLNSSGRGGPELAVAAIGCGGSTSSSARSVAPSAGCAILGAHLQNLNCEEFSRRCFPD